VSTPLTPLPQETYTSHTPEPETARPALINPDDPPWAIPGAVAAWLLSIILIAFTPLVFLLPYAQRKGMLNLESLAEFAVSDKTAIFLQVVSTIPAHLLTLGLAWLVVTRGGKQPFFQTLGWTWDKRFSFWRSAGLAVGLLAIGLLIIKLLGGPETQLDKIINSSKATAFTIALVGTVTAPLVEEVIYRGLLYSALQRAIGAAGAVAIVLSLFALVHVPQYWPNFGVILAICLLSAVITLVRAYSGNLLPCFIIHLVFNGIQSFFIVLEPYLKLDSPDNVQTFDTARTLAQIIFRFN
jgi:membrane protease YdiL (CAAX protease family)